eukprot:TRINITY_DN1172_c0_g1_i2.p2 TRINITY_DN1172_c0_g1~~TRINITY_DN1172_c0_g1_i2.p2  ORF type:complete len:141 (-),score=43.73 TRINITY_DN1172_c0_g1_i2:31-453(-)
MNVLTHLSIILSISSCLVLANESFSGMGSFACYGDMSITFDKSSSAGEGEGFVDCQPSWGSPSAPPQGIIADGADGSHWVTVDDKGYGDCDGSIWYKTDDLGLGYCDRKMTVDDGHQTRLFCGYATCDGYLNIECSMLSG